jgi:hypothetical protein
MLQICAISIKIRYGLCVCLCEIEQVYLEANIFLLSQDTLIPVDPTFGSKRP